ncbi:hypothetical protein CLAFUW4_12899 [Fulvia fulva]|uniref:Uncharacterized protein n=1 Tax=Passalora fulva TaxID=5499 RepID=A0A9Q8UVG4_PASFU|nr:uncharacterized protein CLAFUR5_12765 [Fulvia fulva]KAK4611720.1 hypothetical protein CLAFUR4_12903 [Fulvia fulva]KAK4613141.1 hypothetical protein CLAFUR0_12909 [Fulvia fulva]UJO23875.1 hypothetical protein CLAFUR5_12765 [Fulvia fulva]WPV20984.1 hypothetical protein CLAFUW4_12899 [Fulvia fulva]WPV35788.1 hypothetical protein CLAFUW7_12906 [Fulvia fulva]
MAVIVSLVAGSDGIYYLPSVFKSGITMAIGCVASVYVAGCYMHRVFFLIHLKKHMELFEEEWWTKPLPEDKSGGFLETTMVILVTILLLFVVSVELDSKAVLSLLAG